MIPMFQNQLTGCIIAAAGLGQRMGGPVPKLLLPLEGRTILETTVDACASTGFFDCILVVTHPDYVVECKNMVGPGIRVVPGGDTRQESVRLGLSALEEALPGCRLALIHDGARPFVTREILEAALEGAAGHGAAVAAVPVKDTIKILEDGHIRTPDRRTLFAAQTPQAFAMDVIMDAHRRAVAEGYEGTDDAQLAERAGYAPILTPGGYSNLKVTTPEDLPAREEWRAGTGFDTHALVRGRPLVLGGVDIPFEAGLLGHSDADVLTHAVMDALLGAAGLGDIGMMFPDTDPAYQGIRSLTLLERAWERIRTMGYRLSSLDMTLIAQRPKMAPYREEVIGNLAGILGCPRDRINFKATTTEKLGIPGREEGMAAEAVCILVRNPGTPEK